MFIMVTPLKEDPKKGQILFSDQLKYIEMSVDRSNPRAMVIASTNKKAHYVTFSDDFIVLIELKADLEKSKA